MLQASFPSPAGALAPVFGQSVFRAAAPQFGQVRPKFGHREFGDENGAQRRAGQKELFDIFKPMTGSLSESEHESLDQYTSSGIEVNGRHRIEGNSPFQPKGEKREYVEAYYKHFPGRFEEMTQNLDAMIDRGRLPFDITVYRGVKSGINIKNLKVGQVLEEPGYLSTTPFVYSATEGFMGDRRSEDGNFLFRIKIPKGTPCLNPDVLVPDGDWHISELLFPRDTKQSITGIGTLHGERAYPHIPVVDVDLTYDPKDRRPIAQGKFQAVA